MGVHVLHLDLNRVSESERVIVTVPLELRGEAPGTKQGGIVDHHLFDVEIECPAGEIPDKLYVSIKKLELGGHMTVEDVEVPPHVTMMTPADDGGGDLSRTRPERRNGGCRGGWRHASEPEVIGRKAEDAEEDSD